MTLYKSFQLKNNNVSFKAFADNLESFITQETANLHFKEFRRLYLIRFFQERFPFLFIDDNIEFSKLLSLKSVKESFQ